MNCMRRVRQYIPQGVQLWVVEDGGGDAGAVHGWVGVDGPDQNLQLRLHPLGLLGIIAHHSEASHALACT